MFLPKTLIQIFEEAYLFKRKTKQNKTIKQLPFALVAQSLVGLTMAGWVSLESPQGFLPGDSCVSESGKSQTAHRALRSHMRPADQG